jgi:hypothetical protein
MIQFWYECRRRLAGVLAAVELHQINVCNDDGQVNVVKRRSRTARLLVPPGNLYLKLINADSYVLPEAQWHQWEQRMSSAVLKSGSVITVRHPGDALDKILQSTIVSTDAKLSAVNLALNSLLAIHARTTILRCGETWPLSHGDATVENVCVDLSTNSAIWFDFDMRHREELSAAHRQADDVRALLFSAAACVPSDCFPDLASICMNPLSRELVRSVEERLDSWRRPTVFQLAQAPLSYRNSDRLRRALRSAITTRRSRELSPKR